MLILMYNNFLKFNFRSTIISEIQTTMKHHSIDVDRRHLSLLADLMTFKVSCYIIFLFLEIFGLLNFVKLISLSKCNTNKLVFNFCECIINFC